MLILYNISMKEFYYLIDNINNYSDDIFKKFSNKIKPYKKNRIQKILRESDRKRTILGEMLLIKGLKKYFNIDYDSVDITQNGNGKPYIENKPIFFNISHSFDYCICVFSTQEIGVDIEKHRFLKYDIRNYICNSKELNQLVNRNINTFNVFTAKEAYMKMKNLNLFDIKNVELEFKNNIIQYADKNVLCFFITIISNYSIAVCIKKTI